MRRGKGTKGRHRRMGGASGPRPGSSKQIANSIRGPLLEWLRQYSQLNETAKRRIIRDVAASLAEEQRRIPGEVVHVDLSSVKVKGLRLRGRIVLYPGGGVTIR